MSVTQITRTNRSTTVRTGSAVPAYFLGRSRDTYVRALAATRSPDPVQARAA